MFRHTFRKKKVAKLGEFYFDKLVYVWFHGLISISCILQSVCFSVLQFQSILMKQC